jgi:phage terminase large subunit
VLKDDFNVSRYDIVTCDSAEEKSVSDYRAYGINARPAEKGPGSVRYGMKWLQSLLKIVIDPRRCPATSDEFKKYEYELDKEGNPTSAYPDANNHSIDMTRYAMEPVWRRKGA